MCLSCAPTTRTAGQFLPHCNRNGTSGLRGASYFQMKHAICDHRTAIKSWRFLMKRQAAVFLLNFLVSGLLSGAQAQSPERVFRIGFLSSYSESAGRNLFNCLQRGLNSHGWTIGNNIALEFRWADGDATRLPSLAMDLVKSKPDLIVVSSTPGALAAHRSTSEIPVVFIAVSDPVASGLVASIARPGGNVTGVSNFLTGTSGKLVEYLKTVAPGVARIAILRDPKNAGKQLEVEELRSAARQVGATVNVFDLSARGDLVGAFSGIELAKSDGLIVLVDGVTLANRQRIVDWTIEKSLPSVYQVREFAVSGGLLSYGLNYCQHWGRAAYYVDRILKGAHPSNLPIELPTVFELIVNTKTARAIGVTVPPVLELQANELIE